jgi:hypothetical protein
MIKAASALVSLLAALCTASLADAAGTHCTSNGIVRCPAGLNQYACGFNWFYPYQYSDSI